MSQEIKVKDKDVIMNELLWNIRELFIKEKASSVHSKVAIFNSHFQRGVICTLEWVLNLETNLLDANYKYERAEERFWDIIEKGVEERYQKEKNNEKTNS